MEALVESARAMQRLWTIQKTCSAPCKRRRTEAVHPEILENSIDVILHGLLERKRARSRSVLAPVVDDHESEELFDMAVAFRRG